MENIKLDISTKIISAAMSILRIGQQLAEVSELLPAEQFNKWCIAEFNFDHGAALRRIGLFDNFGYILETNEPTQRLCARVVELYSYEKMAF